MKIGKLLISIASVLVLGLVYYIFLPTLSIGYFSGFMYIAACLLAVVVNIAMWSSDEWGRAGISLGIGAIVIVVLSLIGAVAGTALFNASTMQTQLGTVEEIEFEEMIHQIDMAQIPIVDDELAKKQADKKIGEDVALGSRVTLDDAAIQEVNGEILFVVPLKHSGFFKWQANHTTPGYITVSASNQNKVEYVTELDGQKILVRYSESSFFGYDLKRHIRNQGYRSVGLTEYTFEIDDSGRPYWVVTTFENRTWWSNPEATGVVVVDAQTGETNWYALGQEPEWVDIVQPREFIEDQIDNWGRLVKGPLNFSKEGMTEKTDLMLTVYDQNDCYYFTGMTSVGSDNSAVGFIMVNTKTKKAEICYFSGATESAAMKSAEGLVSDFGYLATEPLPCNVNGIPTFVMSLKDEEGLIKSYAMVNIKNYSIAAKGASLQETARAYVQQVARSEGTYVVGSNEAFGYTYEGVVSRISSVVESGSTYYYLVVEGEEDKIFMAPYTVSDELSITRDGDTVKLSYVDDKNGTVDIVSFENVAFATPKSEDQERRDEMDEGTSPYEDEYSQIVEVNPDLSEDTWNSLSDEEKAKLIDEFLKQN